MICGNCVYNKNRYCEVWRQNITIDREASCDAFTPKRMKVTHTILQELRVKKGLSQRQLAILTGLSNSTISRFESGETDAKISTILKFNENQRYYGITDTEYSRGELPFIFMDYK